MDSLWSNLFKGERKQQQQIRMVLKEIPVFQTLNRREIDCVERILHKRHYNTDEVIFSQGSMGVGMYIVVEGNVQIILEPSGRVLATLGDGEFFGEIALLNESPRTATAVARTPSTVMGLFQGDLFGLADRNPKLGYKIAFQLARMTGRRLMTSNEEKQKLEDQLGRIKDLPSQDEDA